MWFAIVVGFGFAGAVGLGAWNLWKHHSSKYIPESRSIPGRKDPIQLFQIELNHGQDKAGIQALRDFSEQNGYSFKFAYVMPDQRGFSAVMAKPDISIVFTNTGLQFVFDGAFYNESYEPDQKIQLLAEQELREIKTFFSQQEFAAEIRRGWRKNNE